MKQSQQFAPQTIRDISPVSPKKPHSKAKGLSIKIIMVVVLVLIVCAFLIVGGIIISRNNTKLDYNNVQVIIDRTSEHVVLPTDEKPALATVTDSTKLTSSFSGKVENGDKILIYQENKKAIVYRPSVDLVVTIEPVSIDAAPGATQ